jgi:methylated-DNA-[protein]-cysteine S-methyltransferase
MLLVCDEADHVRALDFEDCEARMLRLLHRLYGAREFALRPAAAPAAIAERLIAYFAGDLAAIDAVPVATGGTAFQQLVWGELRRISAGTTISYSALAREIGRPNACRAVGLANAANPAGIVVPCHRVIGANASLTGYGGGLWRKRWLIEHERAFAATYSVRHQGTG